MKNLNKIAALLLICTGTFAQTDPLRTQLNTVFANVDKSQVPTGFLQEYGVPLLPLSALNGVLSTNNTVDIATWRAAYAMLQTSRIYGTNPLSTLATVNMAITNDENANTSYFVVPVLYADYNYLRSDAITAHLLSASNNQLYDVAGRTQSPYSSAKLFAASPSVNTAATNTPTFIFKQDIFYMASTKTLSKIYIDFGDGHSYHSTSWNMPITAAYTDTGTYKLKIKMVFTDNTR